ncbi:hypothetical protein IEQ34_007345 [Dendrobium chrysotoxum]|uniref:Uncharacterized protein n=1 Tax=Dendrobium chrysotoxum TaxID=161865 RepID=A0AAV7H8Y3_DENCH|nr:hypothetical protein IEQ34_007345 [Dendrobium chrysotoxum]
MKMKTDLRQDVAFYEQMIFPQNAEVENRYADIREAEQLIKCMRMRMKHTRLTVIMHIMLILVFARIITATG